MECGAPGGSHRPDLGSGGRLSTGPAQECVRRRWGPGPLCEALCPRAVKSPVMTAGPKAAAERRGRVINDPAGPAPVRAAPLKSRPSTPVSPAHRSAAWPSAGPVSTCPKMSPVGFLFPQQRCATDCELAFSHPVFPTFSCSVFLTVILSAFILTIKAFTDVTVIMTRTVV